RHGRAVSQGVGAVDGFLALAPQCDVTGGEGFRGVADGPVRPREARRRWRDSAGCGVTPGLALLIVDTQAHIWAAPTPQRPWMEGMEKRAHLPVPLDKHMLLAEMDAAGVDRAVLVPPSLDGDRNDLCLAAAAAHPDRFAVMGRLLLDKPYAAARLEEMKQ